MKWAVIAVLILGALGCWAMSVSAAGSLSADVKPMPVPRVVMRPLPPLSGAPIAVAMRDTPPPAKAVEAPAPRPEPVKEEPPPKEAKEPPPPPEPKAPPPAKEPKEPKAPREVKETAEPKPAREPKPSSEDSPPPLPKAKPPPEEKETSGSPPPAAVPAGEGFINLKASDTAEIVVDGRKVGPSPKLNFKLKSGKHKIRFDCYDENGNLKPGKVQVVEIKPDEEHNVDYECPVAQ